MPTIQFVGFTPDADPSSIGALVDMAACLPTNRGFFRPQPALQANGGALPATPFGAIAAKYLNNTTRTFAGTSTHLYELTAGVWGAVDGGTLFAPSTTLPGGAWRFAVFGNKCIAVDGVDAAQVVANTGNFAALGGSSPVAKLVASVANNFVVMANTASFADQWVTCAQGNETDWVASGATQASNGRIEDLPGPITAIVPFGQNLAYSLYKESATYMALYIGPPVIWQFIPISPRVGALTQESVADLGTLQVFPANDDFYIFDGQQVQRLPSPVKSWFFSHLNLAAVRAGTANIFASYDRIHDVVYWFFPTTTTAADTWLAWNIKSNLWATGKQTVVSACLPEVVNALAGSLPSTGIFTTSNILNTIDGAANAGAYITTGDIGDHIKMSLVQRLRPKWATAPVTSSSTTVTSFTRLNLGATQETVHQNVPMSPPGWVNLRQAGRWHAFKISMSTDAEIIGLQVEAIPVGDR